MIWRREQTPGWVRWVFFGLAPLALLAGVLLEGRNERRDPGLLKVQSGRERAIAVAREYAIQLGVPAQDWKAYCAASPDADLFRYLRARGAPVGSRVRDLAPPAVVRVLFESRNMQRKALVLLGLDDRVLGYDISSAGKEGPGQAQTEEQSLATARGVLETDPRVTGIFHDAPPEISSTDRTETAVTRTYTWRAPLRRFRELEIAFTTSIRNGRVLSRTIKATVDPDFAARNLRGQDTLTGLFSMGYLLFVFAVALYSLASYGRQATQNEVSHSRTLWMALIVSGMFVAVIFTSYDETFIQLAGQNSAVPISFVYTLLSLVILGVGVLVGVAYGSGEGDVREAYPGKLTSLDALVLGKVFSRNVGASVMVGAAFACWFLLAWQSMRTLTAGETSIEGLQSVRFPYMLAPWMSFLLIQPATALLFAIGGLVQPLAFGTRWIKNRRARMLFLVFCTLLAVSGVATARPALTSLLITIAAMAPCLLVSFFAYDLLAALVSFTAMGLVGSLVNLVVLYPGWDRFAGWMGLLALLTLLVEFGAWRRGRIWREEEVRPEYARHIAERKDLEAEVAAAREAQLRLLPQEPPTIAGLSICASCLPARVVGGDFYDFFPLSEGRLGIFIAEGGNRGLASALSIALAKGYLMHAARGASTPTEVILRLEQTLGAALEGIVRATVAYAVVDVSRGCIEYARTGSYPKVVIASASGKAAQSEREVPRVGKGGLPVWEGYGEFGEGDGVVLYTDGIARRIANRSTLLGEDWIQRLAGEHVDAQHLHTTLLESIGASGSKRNEELEDDLTAVVIRCVKAGVSRLEVVA